MVRTPPQIVKQINNKKNGGGFGNGIKNKFSRKKGSLIDVNTFDLRLNPNVVTDMLEVSDYVARWTHLGGDIDEMIEDVNAFLSKCIEESRLSIDKNTNSVSYSRIFTLRNDVKAAGVKYQSNKFPEKIWSALFVRR